MKTFWDALCSFVCKIVFYIGAIAILMVYSVVTSPIGACIVAVVGACAYNLSKSKGRSYEDWTLATMVFPPLILVILCLSNLDIEPIKTKKCPFCAENIQEAAILCKHCGKDQPVI